ncbi:cytochrome c oxidase assembly protein subunit 15 [Salsuginibacillus halophilus]|uniref:Heme A synthase n=1 Tax=Salsuginibacillus halophilus TaxID=517424 RepID=A0A2P8HX76_9BACI|nr:heme A synthase [Salsuginibacillus halophilus]PSL50829.1 cytochrome c oxidase assembly protein subunit 15 [Salsuginibacillus halophilus]
MYKGLKTFGILTSLGMILVLLQGSLVTKTGSEDGCGSTWPLCFGEAVPESPAIETIIEYSHRLVSGLVGLMVIVLAFWAWKRLSHRRETKFWSIMAVLFVIFQGLMGAAAVVWGHSNLVLALHFGISAISLATVIMLTILPFEREGQPPAPRVSRTFRYYFFFVLTYCYAVIYTGAYVKHTGSTFACDGLIFCDNGLFSAGSMQQWVHMMHRFSAYFLVLLLIVLLIWSFKQASGRKLLAALSGISVALVLSQAAAGFAILFSDSYLTSGLFHALIVSLLFSVLCYIGMIITRKTS